MRETSVAVNAEDALVMQKSSDARWRQAFEELLKEQNGKPGYRPIIPFVSRVDGTLNEKDTLKLWLDLIR